MTCVISLERVVSVGFGEDCIDLVESDAAAAPGADARTEKTGVDVVLHREGAEAEGVSTAEVGCNQWVEGWVRGSIIHFSS